MKNRSRGSTAYLIENPEGVKKSKQRRIFKEVKIDNSPELIKYINQEKKH